MSNLIVNAITLPRRRKTGREQEEILLPVCGLHARPQMFQTQTRQLRENEIISSMSTSEVSFFNVPDLLSIFCYPDLCHVLHKPSREIVDQITAVPYEYNFGRGVTR
jgi:hypothetical protein